LISRNLYKKHLNSSASDDKVLWLARRAGFLIVALGLIFCYLVEGVAEALTIFWGISTLTGVFIWAGVLWRRTNATGAWASFIIMSLIWGLLGPLGDKLLKPLLPGISWLGLFAAKGQLPQLTLAYLPAGIVALVLGSLIGKALPDDLLNKFYRLIRTPVGREDELVKAGVEIIYQGKSEGHPWELKYPRLVNWGGFLVGFIFALAILGLLYFLANFGG
jgi:Na+/proline symporter